MDNNTQPTQNDFESLNLGTSPTPSTPGSYPEPKTVAPLPVKPPKKSKKGLIITLVAIVLLVIAGAAAYFLYFQPNQNQANQNGTTDTQNEVAPPPADTTDYARLLIDKLKTEVGTLAPKNPTLKIEEIDSNAPPFKYGENKYYITGQFGYSLSISRTGAATTPNDKLDQDIAKATTDTLNADSTLKKNTDEKYTTYQNDNVICSYLLNTQPTYINCANKRDYKPVAEAVKPFADAFILAQGEQYINETVFGKPGITKKSEGYSNATVGVSSYAGVGGYAGLFYGKDNKWLFWKGTQSELACTDYSNRALQLSFEGTLCYNPNDEKAKVTVTSQPQE